jgi:hypothetical protein
METAREFTECSLLNKSDNYGACNQIKLIYTYVTVAGGNSIGIVIRLWAGNPIIRFQFLQGQEIFNLHPSVQTST